MNIKKTIIILYTVLSVLVLASCKSSDNNVLQLNLKKGSNYKIHYTNNSKLNIRVVGKNMGVEDKEDMYITISVRDIDSDGNTTLSYQYKSIKVNYSTSAGSIDYDSKRGRKDPRDSIYKSIIGKNYTVKLNKNGKVLNIKGANNVVNLVDYNKSLNKEEKELLRNNLIDNFSDASVENYIEDAMNYMNENSVKKGDTWHRKSKLNNSISLDVSSKYKLKKENDDSLYIVENDNIANKKEDEQVDLNGAKTKIDLNGKGSGNISVDKKNGLIKESQTKYNVTGTITYMKDEEVGILQDIQSPINFTEDITYKIVPR
ncbi:DUF6263 family protein [Clostridium felsineum]|uniref:Uncharacterized protein n=1 Tax=Clostridium felsineum TaxID=36839 RepID=A0A1S8MFL9_9CLOT|nr:DUF6263 family protein [Clostridium felsineum]MCR3759976.1 hypothetical protein [Clostridium felsineum]URZ05667.1 hypothetical protein CLROS_009930 [Clostridium felsineum]URZ10706.1 hypothetical protein CROST_014160 [Clostridium felsineum]URZ17379.1 hypothetical protein CLFE_034320 [Clostridium felsineum DSM 794]